jgi:hypothetical protein
MMFGRGLIKEQYQHLLRNMADVDNLTSTDLKGRAYPTSPLIVPDELCLLYRDVGDEHIIPMSATLDVHSTAVVGARLPSPSIC